MKTTTIRHSVTFKATAHEVYEALMDSRKHSKFTGEKASISRKLGGKFTAYDGYAEGVNLELLPDERIVQSWRADDWPEGHYSKVTFSIKETATGTRLTFKEAGVPEDQYAEISQGWRDFYWAPMKKLLEK